MSMRAVNRTTGVARQTISDLLDSIGQACSEYQDGAFRNLGCSVIECDEIWSFCYSKQKNVPEEHKGTFGYGDIWTWTAIDADTKLVPSWLVGERTAKDAYTFLYYLRERLAPGRIQITTDGHKPYLQVIEPLFGADRMDFAMLHKIYGPDGVVIEGRYSPAACTGIDVRIITGQPDPDRISTSYVERQNLTMRMGMRRFTRLTNAFSKKVEFQAHAVSLYFMHYNLARPHQTLTKRYGRKTTPAMAAGVEDHVWSVWEIGGLLD